MSKEIETTLEYVKESLENLAYGSIAITVHNGKVTQVDTTEKKRFGK